jgi:hypothetical protein
MFERRWRHWNNYVFTKRQEVGTTVFGPGVVAKVIAVAQRVQYRYGTVVLSAFATTPRPGRAISACQIGTVFERRRATQRHHHYGDHGGRRRHLMYNNCVPRVKNPKSHYMFLFFGDCVTTRRNKRRLSDES